MKKLFALSLMLATTFAIAAAGNARVNSNDVPAPPAIGATIGDFSLPDTDGKEHSLNSLKGTNGPNLHCGAVSGFQCL